MPLEVCRIRAVQNAARQPGFSARIAVIALALSIAPAHAFERGIFLSGPVKRVTDGDTLVLATGGADAKVRLHGIDAPESKQECADTAGQPYPCGERAKLILDALTLGKTLVCEVKDRDRYGRFVGACKADGADINKAMVATGWAMAYRQYSTDYVPDEDAARELRPGMWSGRFVPPEEYRRIARDKR